MKKLRDRRNKIAPFSMISIFILAVLVPSIALSLLALRAADRESLYVERRLEGTLLAEVNLAADRVEELMGDIAAQLRQSRPAIAANPLADVRFVLREGVLSLPGATAAQEEAFAASFGDFLLGRSRLPVYDSIIRVYRPEAPHDADSAGDTAEKTASWTRPDSAPQASAPEMSRAAPLLASAPPPVESKSPAEGEMARKKEMTRNDALKTAPSEQRVRLQTDSALREEAFEQVSKGGFEIATRNVMPQAQGIFGIAADKADAPPPADERSGTVSRSRSFSELLAESDGGFLPRITDRGLELLFWTKVRGDRPGTVSGCTVRMDEVRSRIASVIPELLSEVRILTVVDDLGTPVAVPGAYAGTDWRRPFVAREISPVLPRWEVGAWLTAPEALANRANFARYVLWVLVAILFLTIAVGSAVVIRMLSSEMRIAGQKTTFVANVSHELKTPLTSIRLFAELLSSGKQGNEEKRREYLRIMMSETDRLSHLVDNVLTFSRRDRANEPVQTLCLSEVARDTTEQLRPHLEKSGFSLSFESEGPLYVRGNRESLRQVFMNILSNAEKYSAEQREILVRCRAEPSFAIVEIADRGIGVAPEISEEIFHEFVRGDDSLSAMRTGVGLGLSIALSIARRYGGEVRYAPRPDGGSVFSLIMPIEGGTKS